MNVGSRYCIGFVRRGGRESLNSNSNSNMANISIEEELSFNQNGTLQLIFTPLSQRNQSNLDPLVRVNLSVYGSETDICVFATNKGIYINSTEIIFILL
jgi:hypothetical protein